MNLVAAPVLVPLLTALATLALGGRPRAEQAASVAGAVSLALVAARIVAETWYGAILVLPLGAWAPGVGIAWVADGMSAALLLASAVTGLAVLVYAPAALDADERRFFHPLAHFTLMGAASAFLTGDLFNLFVSVEVFLLASFVLATLGARPARLGPAFGYVLLNLVMSALFLGAVGLVYGAAGTVDLATLGARVATEPLAPSFWGAVALLLVVLAVKAGVAPLFFWLPDAYPATPIPVTALFAGLLTKVGVYALFRVVCLLFPMDGPVHAVLVAAGALTMAVGVVGALGRGDVRGILSFHIVSQVGYMVFALGLGTTAGLAAGLYFLVHNMIVKTALLLAGGAVERIGGGRLGAVRGLAGVYPWLAVAFLVPALSLAGIPPLSGFWGKLFLVVAGFDAGAWVATAIGVGVSLLTLASMLKIWTAAFWGPPEGIEAPERGHDPRLLGPPLALGVLSVVLGLLAAPVCAHFARAAEQARAVTPYVEAVWGVAARP